MGKYRMYEPWGYQEANNYVSKKSIVEDDLAESKKNDKQELKDIEELKKSKVDNVSYDKNENKIVFFANQKEVASVDTTDFVKDGMIESVELDGTVLKIIFNTDSGKEEIDVDFKDIISGGTFYTKDEVDSKLDEKADKSDIPSMDEYAKTADVQTEIANAVSGKADSSDVEAIEAQITPISSDITALKGKDDELQAAIDLKASQADFEALSSNVYTKQESDERFLTEHQSLSGYATEAWVGEQGFLTEHQDISNLATKDEVESGITALAASITLVEGQIAAKADADSVYTKEEVENKIDVAIEGFATESAVTEVADALSAETERAISAETELWVAVSGKADADVVYTQEEVDALLAEKEAEMQVKYGKLKDMVLDLYYVNTYSIPTDCTLETMLKSNNGDAKLTEDITTSTIAAGVTAKNIVKLSLGGKTVTFTGATTTNPAMLFRNKQQVNIGGSGTIDAGGRVAVFSSGVDCEITLSGTMFGRPTYITDRSGGELIYCELGTINITDGIFKNTGDDKRYLLNCKDANYKAGTAKIVVTGGKFYDFNPADNSAEGEPTKFVPEGYHVETSTVIEEGVEHTIYTVKKD